MQKGSAVVHFLFILSNIIQINFFEKYILYILEQTDTIYSVCSIK